MVGITVEGTKKARKLKDVLNGIIKMAYEIEVTELFEKQLKNLCYGIEMNISLLSPSFST